MTAEKLHRAEERREQTELTRTMIAHLRALIGGRMTREELLAWARALWPADRGQDGPFRYQPAISVFDSLWNLDQRRGSAELVREVDLREYLRWLCEGETVEADEMPLVKLKRDIEAFAAEVGTEAIRWACEGFGWEVMVRFCASGTGRPFVAQANLAYPGVLTIHKLRGHPLEAALVDLFEALAIDENDVELCPDVDLSRLPTWALWREDDYANRFEIARFHSYAKAFAQERMFTARGHRQIYWVDVAP